MVIIPIINKAFWEQGSINFHTLLKNNVQQLIIPSTQVQQQLTSISAGLNWAFASMNLQLDVFCFFFMKMWAVIKLQIIQVNGRFYVSQDTQTLRVLV